MVPVKLGYWQQAHEIRHLKKTDFIFFPFYSYLLRHCRGYVYKGSGYVKDIIPNRDHKQSDSRIVQESPGQSHGYGGQ